MTSPSTSEELPAELVTFSLFGQAVAIRSRAPKVFAAYRQLYRHFPEISSTPEAHLVDIIEHPQADDGQWEALIDYMPRERHATLGEAMQRAERRCCAHALQNARELVGIHAATVAFGNEYALVTGDSGSGKTTLTLTLSARGYPIDGDDMATLDPRSGLVRGLPRCFHLDDRSIELLSRQGLDVGAKEVCEGFLTPSAVGDGGTSPRPVKALFFLEHDDLKQPALKQLAHSEAIARLDGQTGPRFLPTPRLFAAFATMLREAHCFELRRGPLGATADLVIATMEQLQPGHVIRTHPK